jgi:general secretion pathway protein I
MNKTKGFSLLEMLVAFTILALSLTIILKIFSTGITNAMLAEDYNTAVQIADGLMAKVGTETPVKNDRVEGNFEKYHWLIAIQPFYPPINKATSKKLSAELYKVTVKLTWDDDFYQAREFNLVTLKLVNKTL